MMFLLLLKVLLVYFTAFVSLHPMIHPYLSTYLFFHTEV